MNNELARLLKDRLKKELQDIIEYNEVYEILENKKDKTAIEHIANDEFSHANIIQEMIDNYGVELSDEYKELWNKALNCFN